MSAPLLLTFALPAAVRWFTTYINQPEFKAVMREAKPAAAATDAEEDGTPKKEKKSAMDLLPPSTFDLEALLDPS